MKSKIFYSIITIINFPTFWMSVTESKSQFIISACFLLSIIVFFVWVDYDAKKTLDRSDLNQDQKSNLSQCNHKANNI